MLSTPHIKKILKKISALYCLLIFGTTLAAGNAELMEQQRSRMFLLNKEIVSTLDNIEGQTEISFSGLVVRGPDGKLSIKLNRIDGMSPYSPPRSFSGRTKIEYITFEEMLAEKKAKPEAAPSKQNAQPAPSRQDSLLYGGGSATDH